MSPKSKVDTGSPKTKKCPICATETALGQQFCEACGHEFVAVSPRFKPCNDCGGLNSLSAKTCQHCGRDFGAAFVLTLDEALRTGAIVRGMDLVEGDVVEGEQMANDIRQAVISSGDHKLIKIIKQLPEESWAKLKRLMSDKEL